MVRVRVRVRSDFNMSDPGIELGDGVCDLREGTGVRVRGGYNEVYTGAWRVQRGIYRGNEGYKEVCRGTERAKRYMQGHREVQ